MKVTVITGRRSRGNILLLVVVTMGLIVAVGVIGFIFNGFLFQCTRAQNKVDGLALALASTINAGDRIGQMNNLEECSRELIYVSRDRFENCQRQDLSFLEPLCYQLLDEARTGQALVEQERCNQIRLICKDLQTATVKYNESASNSNTFNLRWLQTSEPRIEQVFVGHLARTESNVKNLNVLTNLVDFDMKQEFIDDKRQLFKAGSATLPEDGDLDFEFCSLPAYVEGTCSPARNANPEAFIPTSTIFAKGKALTYALPKHMPNAVQISCTMDASIGQQNRNAVRLLSTGITNGATAGSE